MLALCAIDDDDTWITDSLAPLTRVVLSRALRTLRELVIRVPATRARFDELAQPAGGSEVREIVVARGVELRSPTRLLRWPPRRTGSTEPPQNEPPRRA